MSEIVMVETPKCVFCGNTETIRLEKAAYELWREGTLIQVAFPDMPAEIREQLISGTCPGCWDVYMSDKE